MIEEVTYYSLWKNAAYVRLLLAQVISLIGTGISNVCLALLAYELADNDASSVLSIAFALKMVTYIVIAPIFSTLSRRWPKKQVLMLLDFFRAGLFILLPFVDQVWQVYMLMFAINACSAAFTPLFQATLPQVVPKKTDYVKALSISRVAYDLEQILSPILSALLLTYFSFRYLFWIDAITFVLSAIFICLCFIPSDQSTLKKAGTFSWRGLTSGISIYLFNPSLRALWYAYLAAAAASAMVIVNTVVYVHEILKGGDSETALAMLSVGGGSMLVAMTLPRFLIKNTPQKFHMCGLFLICFAFYFGALLPNWLGFILICFCFGIGMSCIQTTSGLIITEASNGQDASQLFAAHFSLTHFWWLLTYLAAGLSASYFGLSGSYWIMLLVSTFSCIAYIGHYFCITRARIR